MFKDLQRLLPPGMQLRDPYSFIFDAKNVAAVSFKNEFAGAICTGTFHFRGCASVSVELVCHHGSRDLLVAGAARRIQEALIAAAESEITIREAPRRPARKKTEKA